MVHDHHATSPSGGTASDPHTHESLLESVGDALALVEADGRISWSDPRFDALPEAVRETCRTWCGHLQPTDPNRTVIEGDERHWEVVARPARDGATLCVLLEVTRSHGQTMRIGSIDASGMDLLHIEREAIAEMTIAERLGMLERRIIESVRSELHFDSFEIRLLEPETNRLELVISENLSPMRVGETLHASETGNGISGWVAATGRGYVCGDVRADPLYTEGLSEARSSLTVPLVVHDRVIGVFNIESCTPGVFDEEDRELAQRFARYIGTVLHVLDLLVVERTTTNHTAARNVLAELDRPMTDLRGVVDRLRTAGDDETATSLEMTMIDMATRVEACAAGPRSIIDAEYEVHSLELVPALEGQRVLVVDDEHRIRGEMAKILTQLGCQVTTCGSGREAFDTLEAITETDVFDLVVSDIRLPDGSGYEVFTSARAAIPDVPVILMTGFGYDPDHTIVRASADGVQGVLLKPFRTSQLIDALCDALRMTTD